MSATPALASAGRRGSRLVELARRHSVGLVASGHLHKAHDFRRDGTRYIWAPASAFLVGPEIKAPPLPGENRLCRDLRDRRGRARS
jgi:hypothetical protein